MFEKTVDERVKAAALAMQRYSWEQGVLAQAFLELGDAETAIRMAHEGATRQTPDGRCAQIGGLTASTDPCAIGEALIFAWERTCDVFFEAAFKRLLRWALEGAPRNAQGVVYHFDDSAEFWVDSMYMLPPFLARAKYFDEAIKQLDGYWAALYRPEKGLLAHMWDDRNQRYTREATWGVGNGWALAGMVRVIALLPESHAEARARLIGRIRGLLDSALPHRDICGLFHDVLDDPTTFVDTNSAQMMAYAIYRGVSEGYLDGAYLPEALCMDDAATAKVDRYGLVRDVCGVPNFNAPGIAPEGQAFFLLMRAAREKALAPSDSKNPSCL